jgi:hypothetical protein
MLPTAAETLNYLYIVYDFTTSYMGLYPISLSTTNPTRTSSNPYGYFLIFLIIISGICIIYTDGILQFIFYFIDHHILLMILQMYMTNVISYFNITLMRIIVLYFTIKYIRPIIFIGKYLTIIIHIINVIIITVILQ